VPLSSFCGGEETTEKGTAREKAGEMASSFAPQASLARPGLRRSRSDAFIKKIETPSPSPNTHHVHAPVLVDDGRVRVIDPTAIGRRQVECGPLGAARRLLAPLDYRRRRRKHCSSFFFFFDDDTPLHSSSSSSSCCCSSPGSLRGHEQLLTTTKTKDAAALLS